MSKLSKIVRTLLAVCLLGTVLVGCAPKPQQPASPAPTMSLKIGVMPAADSAPVFIAAKKGYFKELGLDVSIEVYNNALNRQSALQAGQLDGAITDLIAFVGNVQNKLDIKITTSTDGSFPFLVRKGFEEKKSITVGTMEISVVNFLADQWLGDKYVMTKVFIDEIPARLEMVKQGKVDMAPIPEPMASMGELGGLEKRVFRNTDKFMPEAMVFTGKAIREKEKAIALFHKAYNKAVDDINRNDNEARDVLIEQLKLDPRIKGSIVLPAYQRARIPDEAYLNKVVDWVERVQKTRITVKYADMVERKFLGD